MQETQQDDKTLKKKGNTKTKAVSQNLLDNGLVRDLNKNSGVLHQAKQEKAQEVYESGPQEMEIEIYGPERFNMKFGYMNSQICLSYLVRIEPFTSLFIEYNGKLDHPDRMLSECISLWSKVFKSPQCNSELIPEWYYLPQMFYNKNYCYFGRDAKDRVVSDIILPEWANNDPFYYCMKFREFMENPTYSKSLNYWIDMTFGKRQQSEADCNVVFSTATQKHYENISNDEVSRIALKAASDFFMLPYQLFTSSHKMIGSADQSTMDDNKIDNNNKGENKEDKNEKDIKIRFDETISNIHYSKDNISTPNILTSSLKNHEEYFYLVTKVPRVISLLSVQKYQKSKGTPNLQQELLFEVEFPTNEYVFSSNYISQFTVQGKSFMVIGKLFTANFAIINLDKDIMKAKYYGVDCLTTPINAIHCTKNSRAIITGYHSGSVAIWTIRNREDSKTNTRTKDKKRLPYKLEFKILQSSSAADKSEIISIDSSIDAGIFVVVTKSLTVTVHSLETGQCLNWIKLSSLGRICQGIQLSKNGYFVLATCAKVRKDDQDEKSMPTPRTRDYRSTLQTFGINGESISSKPYFCKGVIKGLIIKERIGNFITDRGAVGEEEFQQDQSKRVLEKLMDDKVFFYDSND